MATQGLSHRLKISTWEGTSFIALSASRGSIGIRNYYPTLPFSQKNAKEREHISKLSGMAV